MKNNAAQYPNVLEGIVLHQASVPANSPNWDILRNTLSQLDTITFWDKCTQTIFHAATWTLNRKGANFASLNYKWF